MADLTSLIKDRTPFLTVRDLQTVIFMTNSNDQSGEHLVVSCRSPASAFDRFC